jgi:hypothetical protein
MITKLDLDNLFDVYPNEGKFVWKNASKYHQDMNGKEAGFCQANRKKQYWVIKINNIPYKRGRLMYFYVNGKFPSPCVDHINGNSLDDRIENLRQATVIENAWNHKKRKRSVNLPMGIRSMANGKFQARIGYKSKQIHLGVFETVDEAKKVYELKRKELYGEFA